MTKRANRTVIRTLLMGCLTLVAVSCGVDGTRSGTVASGVTLPATSPSSTPTTSDGGTSSEPGRTTSTTEADAGTTTSDSSIDSATRAALVEGFKTIGLTQNQATCMADSYIDLGLTDPEAQPDASSIFDILAKCNVSLTDLSGGAAGLPPA